MHIERMLWVVVTLNVLGVSTYMVTTNDVPVLEQVVYGLVVGGFVYHVIRWLTSRSG